MAISLEDFNLIKRKHGKVASWAVWADKTDQRMRSGISDLTVLDPVSNETLLSTLHRNFVLLGLNFARDTSGDAHHDNDFANFHSEYRHATDYRIREAFHGTPIWGAYMTDVFKGIVAANTTALIDITKLPSFNYQCHVDYLKDEMRDLKTQDPVYICFGRETHKFFARFFPERKAVQIPHYAPGSVGNATATEYRKIVLDLLKEKDIL